MKVRTFVAQAAIAWTALGVAACASASHTTAAAPAQSATTQSATPAQSASASSNATPKATSSTPASVPVLSPGKSATFSFGSSDGSADRETWTMGSKIVTAPDNTVGAGYEDIAFNLTVKNAGSTAIQGDPTEQYAMVWGGTNGRTDDTVASTAGVQIGEGTNGLNGQDLELMSGIPANGFATGYVELLVPTSPGAVAIVDQNTNKPDLLINYDNLTAAQLTG